MDTETRDALYAAIETLEAERAESPQTDLARIERNERRTNALETIVIILMRLRLDAE